MRIVSGIHKGRKIQPPAGLPVRPTTDFAKEALFNILANRLDFESTHVLDLFAGTGSLSYECLSRGAAEIVIVEKSGKCCSFIVKMLEQLKMEAKVIREDVFRFLDRDPVAFDLILADPPYALPEASGLPGRILGKGWLKPEGIFVMEHPGTSDYRNHRGFQENRTYGSVNFSIFSDPEAEPYESRTI